MKTSSTHTERERERVSSKNLATKALLPKIRSYLANKLFKNPFYKSNFKNSLPTNSSKLAPNYKQIPANYAYEANLPLPKNYKFILVAPSFNAHSACINYLKKCGCNIMRDHFPFIKEHYIYNYNEALKNKQVVINLTCEAANESYYKELQKLILMLDHNTPILHLVRDPIERLLSALNGNIVKPNLIYNFTHKTPLSALEDRVRGWINKDLRLEDRIKNIVNRPTFHLIKLYEFFLKYNFTKHDFLDLCKYKKEDELFELFTTLSKSYNFQPPRHKEDLSYKYHSLYVGFLPLSYTVNGIKFTLSCQKMDQIESTKLLNLSKNELTKDILIYVEACNLKKIKQNANELRLKIQAFLDKLREVLEVEVKFKRTNKEGLFEFLKTKPDLRRLLRDIFDKDLEYIGQARPDIVASWDYYNEFKAL